MKTKIQTASHNSNCSCNICLCGPNCACGNPAGK